MHREPAAWSDEVKALTRKFIKDGMIAAMKNIDGRFALMGYLNGKIVLFDRKDISKKYRFDNAEELIESGWVVD